MTSTILRSPRVRPADTTPASGGLAARYRTQGVRRQRAADALYVLGWLVIVGTVALWLADGGLAGFGSVAATFTSLGIVTGLVATASLVLMLWLAARVPAIDAAIGHDKALALHAALGQWTFLGLVAHGVFLLIGYALSDGLSLVAEFALLFGFHDFGLAIASIALLTAVSISSVVAARRRLPYEVWQGIHLLTYAAVLASLPHQFSMGGLFADGVAKWTWVALFGATFFALLTFRVFTPLAASLEHRFAVTAITREASDVVSVELTGRRVAALGVKAGQFFHWRFLAPGLWWHQHPFSISAAPHGDTLRVTVRALGPGTDALLRRLRVGTPVMIEGPYGVFTDAARTASDVVLVGIGIGIAPIRALLEETSFDPGHATVIVRASTLEQVYLGREIDALCRAKGARLIVLVGRRGLTRAGTPSWLPATHAGLTLADLVGPLADADVYVCGPSAAADLVLADARAAGVGDHRLHHERFSW